MPLYGEFTGDGWIPTQMASNAENVSIWWRHRVYFKLRWRGKIVRQLILVADLCCYRAAPQVQNNKKKLQAWWWSVNVLYFLSENICLSFSLDIKCMCGRCVNEIGGNKNILCVNMFFIISTSVFHIYREVFNIRRTLVGDKIAYHSDVVEAAPAGDLHYPRNTWF